MTTANESDLTFRFFKNDKLKNFPSNREAQLGVLRILSKRFTAGTSYTEKDVNRILNESIQCRDFAFFRRELIDCGLLVRNRDCSNYRLIPG